MGELSKTPKVSVVIVVYNCERYIAAAVESILQQDFGEFELLVVNNASTDRTPDILGGIVDPRITIIENPINGGPQAANLALKIARGEYVARLDADDVAMPSRLREQFDYLTEHPEVGLCGTRYEMIDADGAGIGWSETYSESELLRWKLGWQNPIGHSTVMMRTAMARQLGGYDEKLWCVQDYKLIAAIAERSAVTVLPSVLVKYRWYPHNISNTRAEEMFRTSREVAQSWLEFRLGRSLEAAAAWNAIDLMRGEKSSQNLPLKESLKVILEYTQACCLGTTAARALTIRGDTAAQLLESLRKFNRNSGAENWSIWVAAARLDKRIVHKTILRKVRQGLGSLRGLARRLVAKPSSSLGERPT